MIDWWLVARHALWIGGAAVVLACWSDRRASRTDTRWILGSAIGGVLFCIGQALVDGRWYGSLIWVVLAVCISVERWTRWRARD